MYVFVLFKCVNSIDLIINSFYYSKACIRHEHIHSLNGSCSNALRRCRRQRVEEKKKEHHQNGCFLVNDSLVVRQLLPAAVRNPYNFCESMTMTQTRHNLRSNEFLSATNFTFLSERVSSKSNFAIIPEFARVLTRQDSGLPRIQSWPAPVRPQTSRPVVLSALLPRLLIDQSPATMSVPAHQEPLESDTTETPVYDVPPATRFIKIKSAKKPRVPTKSHRATSSSTDVSSNRSDVIGKRPVTVDTSNARSNLEVVRLCLRELGWKEANRATDSADIHWHSSSFHENITNFTVTSGRVNKFPGNLVR